MFSYSFFNSIISEVDKALIFYSSIKQTTQYLLLSKNYPNNIGDISDQEYLDREDSYTLMFFIQSSDTGIPRIPTMKVNDWIIRLNDSELGS